MAGRWMLTAVIVAAVFTMTVPAAPALAEGSAVTTLPAADQGYWDTATMAKWACIFSGLALAGVIWIVWNLRVLANNQLELGKMIMALKK